MAHATYTITVNGNSNGNVIVQPFTIEVLRMEYNEDALVVDSQTINGSGNNCENDDILNRKGYAFPAMTSSKNTDLANSIEADLTAAYGANWSKN